MTRRLIGWRVRWEWRWADGWHPSQSALVALPVAVAHADDLRGLETYRNVRVVRVYRRAK